MTATQLAHASLIVNQLEFIEETIEGTFPSNPATNFVAHVAKWTPKMTFESDDYRAHASEDIYGVVQGRQIFGSTLEFGLSNSTFIKYAINAIGGAGTIGKALSLGFSYKLDGATVYRKMTRTRAKSIKLTGSEKKPTLMATMELEHDNITTPSGSDYKGSGSHATPDTDAIWNYQSDGGAGNVTWNSANAYVDDINLTITRTLASKWVPGSNKMAFQYPVKRGIKGDLTREHVDSTLEADAKANTPRTLAWVLKSAVSTLTVSNAYLVSLDDIPFDADADDSTMEKWGFSGTSVVAT